MDITHVLPKECRSKIISFTSPKDACRSASVSHVFQSAADSDDVWKNFLPRDYLEIIASSTDESLSVLTSFKQLYFHLCHNPILINNGTMSFALEKQSGKKCYMFGARELSIAWGNTPAYWEWKPLQESRFSEVANLELVWWLDVKGIIETKILSPKTTYVAYLLFKLTESRFGFDKRPVELGVKFEGIEGGGQRYVLLDPPENMPQLSQEREHGWMEIEMGEFFVENGQDGRVVCSLWEVDNFTAKHGLIIEGIELRPKDGE